MRHIGNIMDISKYEYYRTENGVLYHGDCLSVLKSLPDQCVNCCVTSPPYWGLRDYGVDGQLGLEDTPEKYVENMVNVFREVRRVLSDDGTLWLNLGDSYSGSCGNRNNACTDEKWKRGGHIKNGLKKPQSKIIDLKPKDLVGIPWRVAFALQADGWYLRQDIIWHKPNPMPEGVKDRCTKAHEYIFLLSKNQRYYYDQEEIKEGFSDKRNGNPGGISCEYVKKLSETGFRNDGNGPVGNGVWNADGLICGRNRRSVWTVTTKPFSGAHFAVFPPDLIEPCILAGCPADGTVLDPFMGSGTTALVAYKHNRKFLGIELSETYLNEITVPRIERETRQLKIPGC